MLEESLHLLRKAPLQTLALYCIGTMPFLLGAMFFIADMSRSAFAAGRVAAESLALALLFVWMRCWQGIFMQQLMEQARSNCHQAPRSLRQTFRMALGQATWQPWALLAWPLSLAATVPLPYVHAFFNNLCLMTAQPENDRQRCHATAWRQACLNPGQNTKSLLLMALLAAVVWINSVHAILLPPLLLKTLLGIETVFTQKNFSAFNSTFLAITLAMTAMAMGLIDCAFYVLRCFYGGSLRNGQDLQAHLTIAQLARQKAGPRIATALLLSMLLPILMGTAQVQVFPAPPDAPPIVSGRSSVSPQQLERAIDKVISQPEYAWRMPRNSAVPDAKPRTWLDSVWDKLRQWRDKLVEWLTPEPKSRKIEEDSGEWNFAALAKNLMIVLFIIGIGVAVFALIKHKRRKKQVPAPVAAVAVGPDVSSDSVTAADLPEVGWLAMARDLIGRGEHRLALRAMYLAMLSMLAQNNMLTLGRFKTNRDYLLELSRRAHSLPQAVAAFDENLRSFEDSWYGLHDVDGGHIERFAANQERMRPLARP